MLLRTGWGDGEKCAKMGDAYIIKTPHYARDGAKRLAEIMASKRAGMSRPSGKGSRPVVRPARKRSLSRRRRATRLGSLAQSVLTPANPAYPTS